MIKLRNLFTRPQTTAISNKSVSTKELVRQDLMEGAKQKVSFQDAFDACIFGGDPRKSELQSVLSSMPNSKPLNNAGELAGELKKQSKAKGLKKWGNLAKGLVVSALPVALGCAFGAGVGGIIALAGVSALTATGTAMDSRTENAEHGQIKRTAQRLPGLADRAADRLTLGNKTTSPSSNGTGSKPNLGVMLDSGAVLLA